MYFVQPTRAAGRKNLDSEPSCHPYSVLLQVGFTWPTPVTRGAVRSYRTFSPLPRINAAVCFCGTFPGVAPAGRYPALLFRGARTFLPYLPFDIGKGGHPANWRFRR